MRTEAAVIRKTGTPWEITELEPDEPREGEVRIGFAVSGTFSGRAVVSQASCVRVGKDIPSCIADA